ncbi:hypothetical protein [Microcoleus sp. bin48.metabat.b7b8b9.023]|uniref:hypothetical protein n=1 Tax=Microcoleus sp. bin48.metabat.b7b8b9.023 TaxID=2742710 RepID=UPI0025F49547|nr:hypothetical protein [Microcoleus sp. bin48.metabat.b7b8b9.023]
MYLAQGKGEAFRHIIYEPEPEIYCRNAIPLRIYLHSLICTQVELMKEFDRTCDRTQFINSTVAARVNGYIAGFGTLSNLQEKLEILVYPQPDLGM